MERLAKTYQLLYIPFYAAVQVQYSTMAIKFRFYFLKNILNLIEINIPIAMHRLIQYSSNISN